MNSVEVKYLAQEVSKKDQSGDVEVKEIFAHSHLSRITNGFQGSSYQPYYPFLYMIAKRIQPKNVVVLGVQTARDMAFIHHGCPSSYIKGIDINNVGGYGMDAMGGNIEPPIVPYNKYVMIVSDSIEWLKNNPAEKINLLFIDSDHKGGQFTEEWNLARPMMTSGGVICADDVGGGEMRAAWDKTAGGDKIDLMILHPPNQGFGVFLC